MANKQAESDFAILCAHYNIWAHKWTDVMYCPSCHRPIFMTKHTDQLDIVPEVQQSIVDYIVITGGQPHWVECKGKGGDTRFTLSDINPRQRNFLNSWSDKYVPCWLFITLGSGRAPGGRKAWFIPWESFVMMEEIYIHNNMKSLPWKETNRQADVFDMTSEFIPWELEWGERGVGWIFPKKHVMVHLYHVDKLPPLYGAK